MCISPCYLDDGTEVACRYCWQCKENRVNDLVGRCIAESRYSKKTYSVTLTYAKQAGVNAVTLTYKDVQTFLKKLRRRYGKVRYICAGEYGTEKGRAHWHIALFFKERYPKPQNMEQLRFGEQLPPNEYRVDWEPWEHGFSYFQEPQFRGQDFKYLMKYAIKDQDLDSSDRKLAMSKKPPLGHEFIMDLAKRHVEEAVIPRSFKYKIAGVRKNNEKENIFMMQGQTRQDFITAFKTGKYKGKKIFTGWIEKYGKEPTSEFYDEWEEKTFSADQEPIAWNEIEHKGEMIPNPVFDEKQTIKRIHHKDVIYYEPWVQNTGTVDESTWIEADYFGNEIVININKEKTKIFEDNEWRSVDGYSANQILAQSQIKRIRSFEEAQREELEQMVRFNERLNRNTTGQYQQRTR